MAQRRRGGGSSEENAPLIEDTPPVENNEGLLPWKTKVVYGAPHFAGAAMWIPAGVHIHKFYADVVLVPVGFLAIAIAMARAFDAIVDPLMGWFSDTTTTRWGRRRPYIFIGAPLCGVFYWLLFAPPERFEGKVAAMWFGVNFGLFFFFWTVARMPHYALGPELTQNYHERSSLYAYGETFAIAGTMIASVMPGFMYHYIRDHRLVFSIISASFGVCLVILYWVLVFYIRERGVAATNPFVPGIRRALRNRPFLILLLTYMVSSITAAIPGTLMPFFVTYVLQPKNPDLWLTIFLAVFFGMGFICIPFWLNISRRIGKRASWLISFIIGTLGGGAQFFLGKGDVIPFIILLAWSGSAVGANLFLVPSIQADVIDYDEFHTGLRREGQYVTFWAMIPKFLSIPSASLPIAILGAMGYVPNAVQTDRVIFALRILYAILPAFFSVCAFFIALAFPLTEAVHACIMEGIQLHKKGESAVDPLTGNTIPAPSRRKVDENTGWLLDNFSRSELQMTIKRGPSCLMVMIGAFALLCLIVCMGCIQYVWMHLTPESGPGAVIGVVVAGITFALFLFQMLRMSAARDLYKNLPPAQVIRAHLGMPATEETPFNPGKPESPDVGLHEERDPANTDGV